MRANVFAALLLALTPGLAAAQLPPRTFRLEVERAVGAEQCPDAAGIREAIAVAAGVDPVEAKAAARLVVTLSQGGALARGRWEMFDANGVKLRERTVTNTRSCRALVAELVQTFLVFYENPPAGEPAPAPTPPAVCDATCRAQAREEARRELIAKGYRRPMNPAVAVLAGGILSAGYTADPGGGVWLAGELHGQIFSGALEARALFPSRVVMQPTGFEFGVTSLSAALVPCARWMGAKVGVLGCGFFDLGLLVANVSTVPFAGPPVVATMGLGPRLALHVPLAERFALRAFADLRFAPVPSSYAAKDTGARWQSNVISGLFGVGLVFE